MFIPRVFYPHPITIHQTIHLDQDTSHYVSRVLRLKEGDNLILFNGEAGEYLSVIKHQTKSIIINVNSFENKDTESPLNIQLGQGISRSERMDWCIQKATELGITEISPLQTQRSIVKLDNEKKQKKQNHWQKIAISASEQSHRTDVPKVLTPIQLKSWAKESFDGVSIFFDTQSTQKLSTLSPNQNFRIAVGPESGWHQDEMDFMLNHGFKAFSLGPRILRTETAGIVAISLIQSLFGDL